MSNMSITSPDFENNSLIPKTFTCQGENVNPQLDFYNIPKDATSLVLIVDDPDAPMRTWVHWVVFNIPTEKQASISLSRDSVPQGATLGITSFGERGYGGPCPPSGTHRYFFKLYALDTKLDLDDSANKTDVESAMNGHVIASAQLIGLYKKS